MIEFAPNFVRISAACLVAAAVGLDLPAAPRAGGQELVPEPSAESLLGPFVQRYCLDCHRGGEAEAGVALDKMLAAPSVAHRRREWQRVLERIDQRIMPPADAESPSDLERAQIVAALRHELRPPDCSGPAQPGRTTVHRLNRSEYENTVRDLLGVEFDAAAAFPQDERAFGFDNNGDALALPVTLLEQYVTAAEAIAARAVSTPESITEPRQSFDHTELEGGDDYNGRRVLYTNGKMWATVAIAAPGRYVLRAQTYASPAGDEPAQVEAYCDDQPLGRRAVYAQTRDDAQTIVAPFVATAGVHRVGLALTNDATIGEPNTPERQDRNLFLLAIDVAGPATALDPVNLPAGHRQLVSWTPTAEQWRDDAQWQPPTRELIGRFLARAYRRPASAEEVERMLGVVAAARTWGGSFERGMQRVVEAALCSPQFLFRGEGLNAAAETRSDDPHDPALAPGVRALDGYELASRLSYFLWSTMPDAELLRLAGEGTLGGRLAEQTQRMLADDRADALIRNFGEQWLETRRLEQLERNAELFPEFDDALREALREETFLLLRHIVRTDKPLSELLTAPYSFVNERLARHYGIAGPAGAEFVAVALPPERRAGVLAHGAVLALTSHDDRTSPVLRGKWVLANLLADAPPPPPPGVGKLPEAAGELAGASLRQRLELHRADPTCAVCHQRMDPLGLALENFDAVGRWRDEAEGQAIDARGALPDGRQFVGPAGLRALLEAEFPRVRRALAQSLLTYALGRGLEPDDECTIEAVDAAAAAQGDTFASMVQAIVASAPFCQRSIVEGEY